MIGLGADIYQKGRREGKQEGREEKDREYQSQIEALKAENERLKALLD